MKPIVCLLLSMLTINHAQIEDLDALAPLFDAYRVFYNQVSDIELAKHFLSNRLLKGESMIFLAKEENRPVGFTQLYKTFSSVSAEHSWILNDLFVKPEIRGTGVGERLLKRAQKFALDDNAKGLALETGKNNPAQKLYERLGWEKETEYLHYFWKVD